MIALSPEQYEECKPDFAKMPQQLIPVITQCATTGTVLMLAYMNETAWQKTLASGEAHYWSRSRQSLWHKGDTSGNVQKVRHVYLDCDNDTLLLRVEQIGGAACHAGYASCFYREITTSGFTLCSPRIFDPKEVYK